MPKIFISYRREDSKDKAVRLAEFLKARLAGSDIFVDVNDVPGGIDFVTHLDQQVQQSEVLLALIGPGWASAVHPKTNQRRLHDPNDFVRSEIASALKRKIAVMPVLIDGAPMPDADELPDDLKELLRRNAGQLRWDIFEEDAQRLIDKQPLLAAAQSWRAAPMSGVMKRWAVGAAALVVLGLAGVFGPSLLVSPPQPDVAAPASDVAPVSDAALSRAEPSAANAFDVQRADGDRPTLPPYDLKQLHPKLQEVVLKAREARQNALLVVVKANDAARKADVEAAKATREIPVEDGVYKGQTRNGMPHGFGVLTSQRGAGKGDVYRGEWADNARTGLGVCDCGANNPKMKSVLYVGQRKGNVITGLGAIDFKKNKDRYEGEFAVSPRDNISGMNGFGVYYMLNGIYEGQLQDGSLHGLGVHWAYADGKITHGCWRKGNPPPSAPPDFSRSNPCGF